MSFSKKKRLVLCLLSGCIIMLLTGCGALGGAKEAISGADAPAGAKPSLPPKTTQPSKTTPPKTVDASKTTKPTQTSNPEPTPPPKKSFGINPDLLPNDTPTPIDTNADTARSSNVNIHFLNTGDSDTIIITEGKTAMMIDGGDLDDSTNTIKYLQDLGIRTLKYVIISHGHKDNVDGLPAIISAFNVDYIFASEDYLGYEEYSPTFKAYMEANKLITFVPVEGLPYKLGNTFFQVYNTTGKDVNMDDSSMFVLYTNGKTKALFTGDALISTEQKVMSKLSELTLLKVANHGLNTSTSDAFLDKVNPKYAVILGDALNSTEVTAKLKARDIPVYKTSHSGNITFSSNGEEMTTDNEITE